MNMFIVCLGLIMLLNADIHQSNVINATEYILNQEYIYTLASLSL